MQSVQQQQNTADDLAWYIATWRALVKLDFIPAFFNWLMKALALITEPFASFSAIYIIICAGVPALFNNGLYTAAMALIIGSPELLIVGAFKIASRELAQGNKKAWWLMGACAVLLLLTALTVGDLFVWKWDQGSLNILMGVRCLAGIAYTFTRGVVTDDESELDVRPGSQVHNVLTEFTASVQDTVNQVNKTFTAEVNRVNQSLLTEVNQVRQITLSEINRVNQATLVEVSRLAQEFQRQHQHLFDLVTGGNQGVQVELQGAMDLLAQQNQTALDAAVERIERANSRRMEAVYSRLEQVKVTLESNPTLPTVNPANAGGSPLRLPQRGVHPSVNQQANSEPVNPPTVHTSAANVGEVNQASEPDGTKVYQGYQFTVNHYQVNRVMPSLAMIMAATECGKTLASRIRKRAELDLGMVSTNEE